MVKLKDCPLLSLNNNSFYQSKLVTTNSKDNDMLINLSSLNKNKLIRLYYNELDNTYSFNETVKIYKPELYESFRLVCFITEDNKNTKSGVSIKLSDENIIPIIHTSLNNHSLISKTGLNLGINEFYYASNLESFVFVNPSLPIGSFINYPSKNKIINGYISRAMIEHNLIDYPSLQTIGVSLLDLQNRFLRAAGNLAPFRQLQEDTLQSFKLRVKNLSYFEYVDMNHNNEGTALNGFDSVSTARSIHFVPENGQFFEDETRFEAYTLNLLMRV